ncbi:MAG: SDR family NAD(P)-dependent oxidoreductase [Polymorphobacter sp.]
MKTGIVIGASSGIGEAIARQLAADGWRVGLAARRRDTLDALAAEIGGGAIAATVDLTDDMAARTALAALADELGGVELWVLNAGTGATNPDFAYEPERNTIFTNVVGFAAMADVAMHHCLARGRGRIVGITSIARFRGTRHAPAYSASKAFDAKYLDAMRDFLHHRKSAVTVTDACPGYVQTPLMKAPVPFWVATPEKAARQIIAATLRGRKVVYVTKRWRLIAWALALLPR